MNTSFLDNTTRKGAFPAVLLAVALGTAACRMPEEEADELAIPRSPFAAEDEGEEDVDVAVVAALEAKRQAARQRGRRLYRAACATCHGRKGDGRGVSAEALEPRPRDFTLGVYKWRSTESGSLPLDGDIFRTISRGVPGTMMPAWKGLFSERSRWDLVEYLKTFSSRFEEEGVFEDEIVPLAEPVASTSESVARGKEVFEANKCWECHGRDGRGGGPSAPTLEDSWGRPIRPFDFTTGAYRCSTSDLGIYRTFMTGLNGTPMPSYADNIPEEDRWPLIHFVRSLQRQPSLLERILLENP